MVKIIVSELDVGRSFDFDFSDFIDANAEADTDTITMKVVLPSDINTALKTYTLTRISDRLYRWTIGATDLSGLEPSGTTENVLYYAQIIGNKTDSSVVWATRIDIHFVIRMEVQNKFG